MPTEEKVVDQNPQEEKKPVGRPKKTDSLPVDKDGMVKVKKEALDKLIERLDRVEYAASKAGLAKWDDRHRKDNAKYAYLRTWDGKVILKWSDLIQNTVEKDGNGRWTEKQELMIETDDGQKHQVPFRLYTLRYGLVKAEIVRETRNNTPEDIKEFGMFTFDVKVMEDDKIAEYKIGSNFVN